MTISAPLPAVGFPRYDMAAGAFLNALGGVDSDTRAVKPEVLAASVSGCEISRGQYRKGISPEQSRCNSGPSAPFNACPVLPPVADGLPPAVSTGTGRAPFNDCGRAKGSGVPGRAGSGLREWAAPNRLGVALQARGAGLASRAQSPNSPCAHAQPATASVGAKGVLLKGVVSSAFISRPRASCWRPLNFFCAQNAPLTTPNF